jgi:hypothetical protein
MAETNSPGPLERRKKGMIFKDSVENEKKSREKREIQETGTHVCVCTEDGEE